MPDQTERNALTPPQAHLGYRPSVVSQYTGLPTPTIYRACDRGEIRCTRVGQTIIIPGTEVLRLTGAKP